MLTAFLFSAIICAVHITPGVKSDLSCKWDHTNACLWEISGASDQQYNGKIDISSLFASGSLEVKNAGNDYHYDACSGVPCTGAACGSDICTACQLAGSKNYGLGDIKTVSCDVSQSDPSKQVWVLKLSYTGGSEERKCDVSFQYSPSDKNPELTFDAEKPGLDYHMTVTADFSVPNAPTPAPTHKPQTGGGTPVDLSNVFGLLFIGLLIAAAVGYSVIGIIVQAGVRGKRGTEMIPNFEFWKDFPFLLKDGIVFTFTWPCMTLRNRL